MAASTNKVRRFSASVSKDFNLLQTNNQHLVAKMKQHSLIYPLPPSPACTRPAHPTQWKKSSRSWNALLTAIVFYLLISVPVTGQTCLFGSFPALPPCTLNLVWHNSAPPCFPLPGGGLCSLCTCEVTDWGRGQHAWCHCVVGFFLTGSTIQHRHTWPPVSLWEWTTTQD